MKKVRILGRLLTAASGFIYDYIRFFKFSGWASDLSDTDMRQYHVVKIYHALEKSMSYKKQDGNHGWSTAFLLLDALKVAKEHNNFGYHDKLGLTVLRRFIELPENSANEQANKLRAELDLFAADNFDNEYKCIDSYTDEQFYKGKLDRPEEFFFSRFTLREFKNEEVSDDVIQRAISLATKTPSVCNRQPWHIYYSGKREVIDDVLSHQSGNRGFGHAVPSLIIVTADLKAFMSGNEHYQHWIDGGMISMSLIYALHSLGVASCALNWSQSPENDIKIRKKFNIKNNHTIIMMLACGWPDDDNQICLSSRMPLESFSSKISYQNNH